MKIPSQNEVAVESFVRCESCGGPVILAATGRPRVHAYCNGAECRKAAAAARARASYYGKKLPPISPPRIEMVHTVVEGTNADLIRNVARLYYIPDNAIVADVTFGHGVFWKKLGRTRFRLIGSDKRIMPGISLVADIRQGLPYADSSIDVFVLDPPYVHTGPNGHYLDHRYGGAATTANHSHADILDLYGKGMVEARRVLRRGGYLWVKTQDEIESGRQQWTHIEIYEIAKELGFKRRDLFVLVPRPIKTKRWRKQHHARKTHSYLWVFEQRGSGK
jgi:hypothetical protein